MKEKLEEQLRDSITERILADAGIDDRVAKAMEDRTTRVKDTGSIITELVTDDLDATPEQSWRDAVERIALEIAEEEEETGESAIDQ
jgi:hypothetical protein